MTSVFCFVLLVSMVLIGRLDVTDLLVLCLKLTIQPNPVQTARNES